MSSQYPNADYSFPQKIRTNNSGNPAMANELRHLLKKTYGATYLKAYIKGHPYERPVQSSRSHRERPMSPSRDIPSYQVPRATVRPKVNLNFDYRPVRKVEESWESDSVASSSVNYLSTDEAYAFRCIYGIHKPGKKKKSFTDDGYVLIENCKGIKTVKVFDEKGHVLTQTPISETTLATFEEGEQFIYNGREYELSDRLVAEDIQEKSFTNARVYKRR